MPQVPSKPAIPAPLDPGFLPAVLYNRQYAAAVRATGKGVPLVIGTAGTCGTDATVDWLYDITCELAAELGQKLTVTRLYSSQNPEEIAKAIGFLADNDQSSFMTGHPLIVDGGATIRLSTE